jgi:hypothetical protein
MSANTSKADLVEKLDLAANILQLALEDNQANMAVAQRRQVMSMMLRLRTVSQQISARKSERARSRTN